MNEIEKIIKLAEEQVGYLEKKSNSNLDSKTENAGSNNYNKYARDLDAIEGFYNGKKNGYAWCDIFCDWLFIKAFGIDRAKELICYGGQLGAGCGYSMQYYKNKGQFYKEPKRGDQIFFKNGTIITHTGIVTNVSGERVYTIEGNTNPGQGVIANGGQVAKKSYFLNNGYIAGYGRPNYNTEQVSEQVSGQVSEQVKPQEPKKTSNVYVKNTTVGVWQRKMNATYNCGLSVDNCFGQDCKAKANKYYLKKGNKNIVVGFIQERLNLKGFNCGKVDNIFGDKTRNAVISFQRNRGLAVDGCVGAKTIVELLK